MLKEHPPSSLIFVQGHSGARFVADFNTINLAKAIFEFLMYTIDIEENKIIFGSFPWFFKIFKNDPLEFDTSGLRRN